MCKRFFLINGYLFFLFISAGAQISLQFTVKQNPVLTVDAGKDTVVVIGNSIQLGGTIVAMGGSGTYTYLWTPVTGLDNPTLARPMATINNSITYSVEVDDGVTCKRTSQINVIANIATAVTDLSNLLELKISPNPAIGFVRINTGKPVQEKSIQLDIYDQLGRVVKKQLIPGGRKLNEIINVADLPKGVYILQLRSAKLSHTQKLSVQ